ncbi:MAG TPA: PAS domain-containing protein, partial [Candidatus Wallbacteria bacterium]|nr:PAS domain-containing protein [Candidatus Wallbacteria bacterium]
AEDQDIYYLRRKNLLETGEPQTFELRMQRRDASFFWARLEISASVEKATCETIHRIIISDITERKLAEEARLNEARYYSILEGQTELICRYLPNGKLSFANSAYARYYKKDQAELINKNFIPHIPEPDL